MDSDETMPGGITISAQLSGTPGGTGTYQTNATAALGSAGSPVSIHASGAFFAKDRLCDNIHPNARGHIAGGKAWADAIKAWLPQAAH